MNHTTITLLYQDYFSRLELHKNIFVLSIRKVKTSRAQSQEIREEYHEEYEQYEGEYVEYVTEVHKNVLKDVNNDGNEKGNGNEEDFKTRIYERYDGDYEAYNPRYATYSKTSNTYRGSIIRNLITKKWVVLLTIALIAICGIVVGLSVHFTTPESPTPVTSPKTTTPVISPRTTAPVTSPRTTTPDTTPGTTTDGKS